MLSFLKVVNIIACVLLVVSIISFFSLLYCVSVSVCCSMGFMPEIKIHIHTYIHRIFGRGIELVGLHFQLHNVMLSVISVTALLV